MKERDFKPKTDFERNIVLREVIRILKRKVKENINIIEGLLDNINTLKAKIKGYGFLINNLNIKIGEERRINKELRTQIKTKNAEIYKLITNKYTKQNGTK